ncbi:MAG: peptidylprolyl isomerase [Bacteroidetes bacterium]|nr:peptidylprolyl isomerase [Bacteroidota bacterium]
MKKIIRIWSVIALFIIPPAAAQIKLIDEIVAVVGNNVILYSDIETQILQYRMQGKITPGSATRCQILESLLYQKLLLNQAELDSIEVTDSRVETSMDARLRYYITQFGSKEKLEEFYQKSVIEIKEELRELVREQMKIEEIQNKITADIQVSPADVKNFYNSIPKDSLPLINTEYQIGQIVKNPPISLEELTISYDRIKALRDRIINGEKFSTLAILYSEDPGSASKGGELGTFTRGTMYPEFEGAAFNLKESGDVSEIIKTEAGYHIIQLIERNGDYINVRHILIQPKVSPDNMEKAKMTLDSVHALIVNKTMTFEEAALKFSDDPGKVNGGLIINSQTNNTSFQADQLDPGLFFVIDNLEVNNVSEAVKFVTEGGKEAYRILYLNNRTEPHRLNMKDDYNTIQSMALDDERNQVIQDWVREKINDSYVKINDRYKNCVFQNKWF